MTRCEEVLVNWLHDTLNDYYLLTGQFIDDSNFKIFEHVPEADDHQFWILLERFFPSIKEEGCHYTFSNKVLTFSWAGQSIEIRPYDDEIYHTLYVKEDP